MFLCFSKIIVFGKVRYINRSKFSCLISEDHTPQGRNQEPRLLKTHTGHSDTQRTRGSQGVGSVLSHCVQSDPSTSMLLSISECRFC